MLFHISFASGWTNCSLTISTKTTKAKPPRLPPWGNFCICVSSCFAHKYPLMIILYTEFYYLSSVFIIFQLRDRYVIFNKIPASSCNKQRLAYFHIFARVAHQVSFSCFIVPSCSFFFRYFLFASICAFVLLIISRPLLVNFAHIPVILLWQIYVIFTLTKPYYYGII